MVTNILIVGYGRSGSTILEQVLATQPEFTALGEVRHLWQRGFVMNTLCTCGSPFHSCPFWRDVDERAFSGLSAEDARDLLDVRRRLLRPAGLLGLFLGRPRTALARADLDKYRRSVLAVYEAAADSTGARVLVDSSKDPLHGLALSRLPGVSWHVIHLVRDARGVALSLQRPKVRPEVTWKTQRETTRRPARTALVWMYRNLASSLLRASASTYRTLRYEDFVADPDAAVSRIREDVGLSGQHDPVLRDGRVGLPTTHSVSGNAIRFDGRDVALRLDDQWRTSLSTWHRAVVTALAAPLLIRYGYIRRRGARP
jgi:Sulfotransferase family